jgi:hypothetical protein
MLWMVSEMVVAGPLEVANSAYDKGDFGLARNLYSELANQGDRLAQFKLGVMYEEGKGVTKDSREAIKVVYRCIRSRFSGSGLQSGSPISRWSGDSAKPLKSKAVVSRCKCARRHKGRSELKCHGCVG